MAVSAALRHNAQIVLRQDYRRPPRPSKAEEELTLTQEELARILQEASSRNAPATRDVTTVDGALEAARELGIPDEHLLEAVDRLRAEKSRRVQLKGVVGRRRDAALRYLGVTLLTTSIVAVTASPKVALIVLVSMLLPLFKLGFAYYQARAAMHDPHAVLEPIEGECRVCAKPAVSKRGRYCADHR